MLKMSIISFICTLFQVGHKVKKIVIIGAGLLGCFSARALTEYDADITVLEKNDDVCQGISKAGTGIVYSGYDTKPGTVKSELTIRSNMKFENLCNELDVRFRKCGSMMVSFGPHADERLMSKLENGRIGGIAGLRIIGRDEALEMEPCLAPDVSTVLYSETTGTVDPWELGIVAYECASANGASFRFNETVRNIVRLSDGFTIETDDNTYKADVVVNCGGLGAPQIREMCERPLIRLLPTAADYYVTDRDIGKYVSHIIFHESEEKKKGLTIVPTVGGNLLIGPTERKISEQTSGDRLDLVNYDSYACPTAEEGLAALRRLCERVVPGLPLDRFIRNYGTLRPTPYYVNEVDGTIISEKRSISELKLVEENGLFSLIGVKTPGMTMAAELADYLTAKIIDHTGGMQRRSDYDPCRRGIVRVSEMDAAERSAFVSRYPDYGRIVCRCEGISEGEIREAIKRGATTVEAVKRRTSAGMGRCQGGYCRQIIREILEEENEKI